MGTETPESLQSSTNPGVGRAFHFFIVLLSFLSFYALTSAKLLNLIIPLLKGLIGFVFFGLFRILSAVFRGKFFAISAATLLLTSLKLDES
jgi:hypothetical protein